MKTKSLIYNLLLITLSLFFCFLIAEIILRIIDPKQPKGTTYGYKLRYNSLGFRDRDYLIPKSVNKYRIVVLGDSFTWGLGVDENDTIPKLLESDLQEFSSNIEVINCGIEGTNTVQQLNIFKQRAIKYDPDLVLLIYYLNDIDFIPKLANRYYDSSMYSNYLLTFNSGNAYGNSIRRFISKVQIHSYFVSYLVPRIGALLRKFGVLDIAGFRYATAYNRMFDGFIDGNPGWEESKRALREIIIACNKNKNRFILAIYPPLVDLNNYPGKKAHLAIANYCKSLGITSIDLLQSLENKNPVKLRVNYKDPHPNAVANKLVTMQILTVIKEAIPGNILKRSNKMRKSAND